MLDSLYQYQPLKEGEIRLAKLHLRQGKPGANFIPAISIVHAQLEDVKGQYDALSYIWGNTDPNHMRLLGCVGSCRFMWIGENLWSALSMLVQRLANETNALRKPQKLVWIDAICINQADEDEKSKQVTKMRDIYRSAIQTVAYLGDEQDDSRLCMWFIGKISRRLVIGLRMEKPAPDISIERLLTSLGIRRTDIEKLQRGAAMSRVSGNLPHDKSTKKLLDNHRIMKSLALVLARPYFQRVWTVQEWAVAQNMTMYCGLHSCSPLWLGLFLSHTLCPTGVQLGDYVQNDETRIKVSRGISQFNSAIEAYNLIRNNVKYWSKLHHVLVRFRSSRATNELDKVYALFGLCSDEPEKELTINYRTTKAELFTRVAKYIACTRHKAAEVLYEAARSEYNPNNGLPSWAPDWTEMPIRTCLGSMFSASARGLWDAYGNNKRSTEVDETLPKIHLSGPFSQGNLLRVKAAVLQQVISLGSPPAPNSQASTLLNTNHLINVIDDLINFKKEMRSPIYQPTKQPIDTALKILLETDQLRLDGARLISLLEDYSSSLVLHAYDLKTLEEAVRSREPQEFLSPICENSWDARNARYNMIRATAGRRFAVTDQSFAGLVPSQTEVGDWMCILEGATVPFVLREKDGVDGGFVLVGDCYVHGMMLGEMFDDEDNQPEMREIVIM
ncbi:het-domain protein [Podospora fimiseda]|uniref:Het-domain protein n=1 Tax=Podospora fimiseda TaxID=252190 RepID=A0AAN7BG18_9PEZI|nr:het-domain protein [Podospora fimiseda]